MIKCKETELGKLRLRITKKGVFGKRYTRYNDKTYKEKYLRRDTMTRHRRKVFDWNYKDKTLIDDRILLYIDSF